MKYTLEIYEPGSLDAPIDVIKSDSPFGAISKGDILEQSLLCGGTLPNTEVLIVEGVHHMIWQTEQSGVGHKILVYTKSIPNERENIKRYIK